MEMIKKIAHDYKKVESESQMSTESEISTGNGQVTDWFTEKKVYQVEWKWTKTVDTSLRQGLLLDKG